MIMQPSQISAKGLRTYDEPSFTKNSRLPRGSCLGVPYFHKAPIMGLYPTHKWFSRRTPKEKEKVPLVIPSQTLVVFE